MFRRLATVARRLRRQRTAAPEGGAGMGAMLTLLSVIFMNIMGFGIVVPLLPFYAQSFNAEPWAIALVFSAYSLGAFFSEPIWGRLSDRIGRKPLLISTVCGTCLCYGILAFAPNIYVAFFVRLIGGMASGNASVIQAYIADVTPPSHRSGRMGLLGAGFNVGFILGPALGGILANPALGTEGFRLPLLTASALAACSAVGVLLFVKETRKVDRNTFVQPSRLAMLGFAARDPAVSRLILVTFVAGFALTGIESTFGFWAHARFDWGPREIGLVFGLTGVVSAICQAFLTGPLSRQFGEATMLAAGMGLSAVCFLAQAISPGQVISIALFGVAALGNSVAYPNVSALISRVTDPDNQGAVMGLNNATGAFARVAGPLAAGIAFAQIDANGPWIIAALASFPAILLALAAGRAARRTTPIDPLPPGTS
jgi:MFS family permease